VSQSRIVRRALVLFGGLCLLTAPAYAQATRTWVSGVGDDANPCSRTAPCKTFAGAISKTAPGGEIDVLDPGGFGAVTITKAISIEAVGVVAGVLVSGTNAIIVSAGANDNVVLRGLTIEGLGTGLNGIRFISGNSLTVEDCTINNFTQKAIDFEPASPSPTTSHLFVRNTVLRNNNTASTSGGILVKPTFGFSAAAALEGIMMDNNKVGLRVEDNSRVSMIRSSIGGSNTNGVIATSAGGAVDVFLTDSQVVNSINNGIRSDGGAATVRISRVTITGNGAGLVSTGGAIISFGNNSNDGNPITDGAPTSTIPQQ